MKYLSIALMLTACAPSFKQGSIGVYDEDTGLSDGNTETSDEEQAESTEVQNSYEVDEETETTSDICKNDYHPKNRTKKQMRPLLSLGTSHGSF